MKTNDPTREEFEKEGGLTGVEAWLNQDFDRARDIETQMITEFDKSLWLANAGAATVSIGFITSAQSASIMQFMGSVLFVVAIICLLLMRFAGETNASRDRIRRQEATRKFFGENSRISILGTIRDSWFKRLAWCYKTLKASAAILFIAGCISTLIGVYPNVITHNKSIMSPQKDAAGTSANIGLEKQANIYSGPILKRYSSQKKPVL